MKTIPWYEAFGFLSKFKTCLVNTAISGIQVCGDGKPVLPYITFYMTDGRSYARVLPEENQQVEVTKDGSLVFCSQSSCWGNDYRITVVPLKKEPYVDYSEKSWSASETS